MTFGLIALIILPAFVFIGGLMPNPWWKEKQSRRAMLLLFTTAMVLVAYAHARGRPDLNHVLACICFSGLALNWALALCGALSDWKIAK